ncbi:MAG TPA: MarR family winged helix-turn-helix transcriptional regulator [Conexibacter sp.]|jgi:DNA-binding MarR family transcriptional regulator
MPSTLPVVNQPVRRSAALLDHLAHRMRARSERALAPLGMRPRHLVALTILRDNGVDSQQQLSGVLQLDPSNVVGLLNELEADGLVERRRSAEDRRRHVVELTPAGLARLARAEFALAAVEDEVLAPLTAEDRATLNDILFRATDAHDVVSCSVAVAEQEAVSACDDAISRATPAAGRR